MRGHDITELIGTVTLTGMAYLEITGRLPTPSEAAVFDAMCVAIAEHGLTPSTLAARLTYLGSPDAVQGAIAAGILGVGSAFVGTAEGCARLLQETPPEIGAAEIVRTWRERRARIPGLGHPVHRPVDPRTERLFEIAEAHGFRGRHVERLIAIQREAEAQHSQLLPINATGAIGAIATELGLPWKVCRSIGVIARTIGLVGHIVEESEDPLAQEIWNWASEQLENPPPGPEK